MSPPKVWEIEEDCLLRKYYPEHGLRYCVEKLERWEYTSVRSRIQRLNLGLNPGVKAKRNVQQVQKRVHAKAVLVDALIRKHHEDKTAEEICFMAGVKRYYVHSRARKIGIGMRHVEPGRRRTKLTTRQFMERQVGEVGCLALFMPWGNYERELHEVML